MNPLESDCAPMFAELIRLLSVLETHPKLFPKPCRVCGLQFLSLSQYLRLTVPIGHGIEDCSEVMDKPHTMLYRHCACGNTLVMAVTEEHMPEQRVFWDLLRREAEMTGKSVNVTAGELIARCENLLGDYPVCGPKQD